jgi:flagellar basal-body rod protein FlgG
MPAVAMDQVETALAQGHLEGSNVNPIDTLVAMIAAQRAFEVQSKVMTTEDEMLEKSVNNLPRVGG